MLLAYMPKEDTSSTNGSVDAWYMEQDRGTASVKPKTGKKLAPRKKSAEIH
jgi:hypothetical protein